MINVNNSVYTHQQRLNSDHQPLYETDESKRLTESNKESSNERESQFNKLSKMFRKISNFKSTIKNNKCEKSSQESTKRPQITVIHKTVTKNNVKLFSTDDEEDASDVTNCNLNLTVNFPNNLSINRSDSSMSHSIRSNDHYMNHDVEHSSLPIETSNRKIEDVRSRSETKLTNCPKNQQQPTKLKSEVENTLHRLRDQESFYFLESHQSKNLTIPDRSSQRTEGTSSENGRLNAKLYKKHHSKSGRDREVLDFENKKLIAESLVKSNRQSSDMNSLFNDPTNKLESTSNLHESNGTSHKIPSYIGISCAISGYGTYSNRYKDSMSPSNQVKRLNDTTLSISIHNSSLNSTLATKQPGQFLDVNRTIESYNSFKNNLNRFNNLSNHHDSQPKPKPRQPPPSNHSNHFDSLDNSFLTRDRTMINDSSQEDDNKSLVQKRIESLYGQNFASIWKDRIERSKIRNDRTATDSFRSPSCPPEFINNGLISSKKNLPVLKYIQNTIFNNNTDDHGHHHELNKTIDIETIKQQVKSQEAINLNNNEDKLIKSIVVKTDSPISLVDFNDKSMEECKIADDQLDDFKSNDLLLSIKENNPSLIVEEDSLLAIDEIRKGDDEVDFKNLNQISNCSNNREQSHNGEWYLKKLDREIAKINDKIGQIEEICLDENLNNREEIDGKIRASVGKAHLLVNKKLSQFKELCNKNMTQTEDEQYKTLDEDLEGFYEMVHYQIDDIHKTFDEILFLKNNNWIVHNDLLNPSPRKTGSKCSSRTNSNANSRNNSKPSSRNTSKEDLRRLKLREAKLKHQNQQQQTTCDDIVIFLPNNRNEARAELDS